MSPANSFHDAAAHKTEAVQQLVGRAVVELRDLQVVVQDLEGLVGNLVLAGSFGSSQSIYNLQKLDRLRQDIGGIADYLSSIGQQSDPGWRVDSRAACATITLADLADRLGGLPSDRPSNGDETLWDFELFDADETARVA